MEINAKEIKSIAVLSLHHERSKETQTGRRGLPGPP